MEGIIHSIESLAAVDGEGLRCSVFLSGCPLRCAYCHNPDTWEMQGKRTSSYDLVRKIARFRPYFGENGGVTFSGGEPLLQAPFLREVAELLLQEKIPYILDTSGHVEATDDVLFLLKYAQGVLLDLKFWDNDSYLLYTGKGIQKTLDVFRILNDYDIPTTVRTVVVPNLNDTIEHIDAYLNVLSDFSCVKYELLPFHTMGFFKYEKLGIHNPFQSKKALSQDKLIELQSYVKLKRKNG